MSGIYQQIRSEIYGTGVGKELRLL